MLTLIGLNYCEYELALCHLQASVIICLIFDCLGVQPRCSFASCEPDTSLLQSPWRISPFFLKHFPAGYFFASLMTSRTEKP